MLTHDSALGEIKVLNHDDAWITLAESEGKIFSMIRHYGDGKVFAAGHDGVLTKVNQSGIFMMSALGWLNLSSDDKRALFSSGHCEIISFEGSPYFSADQTLQLEMQYKKWVNSIKNIAAPIDETKLEQGDILIIGNAWGDFTQSEIDAVEKFVKNGGSLLVVGLGWSWKDYSEQVPNFCKQKQQVKQNTGDISTYPMNKLMEPYQMQWTEEYIKQD